MTCGRCGEDAENLPFRWWFCTRNLCGDCADVDGTCRTHPEVAQLSDQEVVERVREIRRHQNNCEGDPPPITRSWPSNPGSPSWPNPEPMRRASWAHDVLIKRDLEKTALRILSGQIYR